MGKNGYMTWDEIKEIDDSDIGYIGHHSHTHEYLIDMTEEDFTKDIETASKIFRKNWDMFLLFSHTRLVNIHYL